MIDPKRGGPPVRLGAEVENVLGGILRSREARIARVVTEAWVRAVGARAAAAVRPIRLLDGVLLVRAVSPVWLNELRMRADEVLDRLRHDLGGAVRRLDVRLGVPGDVRAAAAASSFVARGPMPALRSVGDAMESEDLRRLARALADGRPLDRRGSGG